jgi:hypothetical protein
MIMNIRHSIYASAFKLFLNVYFYFIEATKENENECFSNNDCLFKNEIYIYIYVILGRTKSLSDVCSCRLWRLSDGKGVAGMTHHSCSVT